MDPREKNLPKWAQDILRSLRLENVELLQALDTAKLSHNDRATGKVVINLGFGAQNQFPIDDRSVLDFFVNGRKISVMLRENGTLLDINSEGRLHILPRAANCVYATSEDR